MNIKLGMPEILVVFALFMYPQSFSFAMTGFALGITGRIFEYIMTFHEKQQAAQKVKDGVDEVADALKGIFNPNE